MKESQLLLGAHTSTAGGVQNALLEGREIGATTIQMFTANQRQWKARVLDVSMISAWEAALKETKLSHIMSHDSYLINLGASDPEILAKSRLAFHEELQRCHALGITYLNFHPGAAGSGSVDQCLDRIVESLLQVEKLVAQGTTRLLLETTAGQGTAVGRRFEEIVYILDRVKDRMPIGVCVDTCHIFVAGYDLRTVEACEATFAEFDRVIGLKWLYAFHLNDSVKTLGTRVDRHRCLGEGEIGLPCFKWLMQDKRFRHLPKYLETPEGPAVWKKEIQLLRDFGINRGTDAH